VTECSFYVTSCRLYMSCMFDCAVPRSLFIRSYDVLMCLVYLLQEMEGENPKCSEEEVVVGKFMSLMMFYGDYW
jgi:hypothetical protein